MPHWPAAISIFRRGRATRWCETVPAVAVGTAVDTPPAPATRAVPTSRGRRPAPAPPRLCALTPPPRPPPAPRSDAAAAGPFAVRHGGHRVPLRSRSTLLAGDLLVFFDEPTHSAFARLLSRAGADCRLLQDDASDSVVEAVQARARRKRSRSGMPPAVIVVPLQPKSPPTRAALRANRAAVTAIKAAGALRVGARTIVDALAAGVSYEAYATASASQQPSLTPSMAPSDSGTLEASTPPRERASRDAGSSPAERSAAAVGGAGSAGRLPRGDDTLDASFEAQGRRGDAAQAPARRGAAQAPARSDSDATESASVRPGRAARPCAVAAPPSTPKAGDAAAIGEAAPPTAAPPTAAPPTAPRALPAAGQVTPDMDEPDSDEADEVSRGARGKTRRRRPPSQRSPSAGRSSPAPPEHDTRHRTGASSLRGEAARRLGADDGGDSPSAAPLHGSAAAITARHDAPSKRQRDQAGAEVAANAPLEASGPAPKRPRGEPLLADAAPSLPSEASSVMAHFAGSDGVAEAANGPAAEAANSVEPTTMTRGPDPASEEADGWLRGDDEDCDGGGRRLSDEDPRRAGVDAGIAALARDVAAGRALVVSVGARADASPPPDGVAVVSSTPGWGTAPAASAELFQAEAGEWVPCDAGEAEDGVAGEASAADLERWLSRPMAGETLRELRRRVGGSARPEAEPEPTRADLARGMGRPLGRAGRDASREGEEGEREGAIASLEAGADTAWQSPAVLSVPLSALLARSDPQASAQVEVSDVTSYYDRAPGGGGEGSQQGRPFMKQWPAAGRAASARFQLAASSAVSPSAVAFVQERRDTARVARQEAEAFAAAQHPKLRRKGGRSTAGVGATAAAWDGEEAGQGVIEAPAKRQAAAAACPPIKPRSGGQQALLPGAAPPARAAATVKTTRRRRR